MKNNFIYNYKANIMKKLFVWLEKFLNLNKYELFDNNILNNVEIKQLTNIILKQSIKLFNCVSKYDIRENNKLLILLTCFIIIYKIHTAVDYENIDIKYISRIFYNSENVQNKICKMEIKILELTSWDPMKIV